MAGAKGPHGFPLPGRAHVFISKLFGGSMAFCKKFFFCFKEDFRL
jgi:hypothetical protein